MRLVNCKKQKLLVATLIIVLCLLLFGLAALNDFHHNKRLRAEISVSTKNDSILYEHIDSIALQIKEVQFCLDSINHNRQEGENKVIDELKVIQNQLTKINKTGQRMLNSTK